MRNYGINYDTGLTADGDCTRKRFDDAVVQRELQIIAGDLHATAVRVSGDDPQRLARAGQHARAAGLELWFSPVPINQRASHHLPRWHHPHRGIRCESPIHAAGTTWLGHSRRINSRAGGRQAGSRATTATAITRQMPSPGRQAPANPGGPRKARNPRR
jgi:hypothetical protein